MLSADRVGNVLGSSGADMLCTGTEALFGLLL